MKDLDKLEKELKEKGEILIPMTKQEYLYLESKCKCSFPLVYKHFLLKMGKGAGRFMKGASVFYNEIFELQKWGEELVEENNFIPIPQDAIVFWMHQGYQMAFFILNTGDNPLVYYFSEEKKQMNFEEKGTLSNFFNTQLKLSEIE